MNNAFYERLYSLLKKLTPDIDSQADTLALLYAFSSGFKLVLERLDFVMGEANALSMSVDLLNAYCVLLDIDVSLEEAQKRSLVKEKLSLGYSQYNLDEYLTYYKSLSSDFFCFTINNTLKLGGMDISKIRLLPLAMRRLEYYLPPHMAVILNGGGITFEQWESADMTFADFDYVHAPFSVLDTMNA